MAEQDLRRFLDAIQRDPVLQGRCARVRTLMELVALCREAGYAVSPRELQLWAHDEVFSAPWWPWASQGKSARIAFFRGDSQRG